MSRTTPIDRAPEKIAAAYHEFKGSSEYTDIPTATEMTEIMHTARTSTFRRDDDRTVPCVTAYLKDTDGIPEIVEETADRHGLVEIARNLNGNTVSSVTYIRQENRLEP